MRDIGYAGSLSATQLAPVVRCLDQLGIPKAPILRAAELEHAPFDELFARFPVDAEHRLWTAIERHTNDPAIGLKGGVEFARRGRHGVDLYLALHSGTARAAFANAERFARLADDWGHIEVREHAELATVRHYRDGGLPRAHGAIDAQFSAAVTLLSDRLPGFFVRSVQLRRPRPEHTQPYLAFYGVAPEFGATDNTVTFDRSWLDAPLRGSDDVLGEILLQQVVTLLRETPSVHPLIARVQKVVLDGLARGAISLSVVAHATGTSPRTLRRRLSALGVNFNTLLDSLRRELAAQYLRSGNESIADIAERLGFAGTSAFQRAFQRWERMPPSTYRRIARDGTREPSTSSAQAAQ